ncbi:unnamed protein product [Effrenium voratum]|nr:unnamed protein product [Effrenium voratum]
MDLAKLFLASLASLASASPESCDWAGCNGRTLLQHRVVLGETQGRLSYRGEFHDVFKDRPAIEALQSAKCRNYFGPGQRGSMIYDVETMMLRPQAELKNQSGSSLSYSPPRRLMTFEDQIPQDQIGEDTSLNHSSGWCMPLAVRTAARPIKVSLATLQNRTLMMGAVWKCASTSMRAMLQSLDGVEFLDAHGESKDFCAEQNFSWPACEKTSSFLSAAVQATWKVATIRDPFERFMASVNEHGKWSSCDGEVCQDEIEKAKDLARTLATQFPGTYRSCEHPTMSYFLSATDLNGNPVVWDMLLEVDDLSSELQKLSELTGWALNTEQENSSGDDDIKRQRFLGGREETDGMTRSTLRTLYAWDIAGPLDVQMKHAANSAFTFTRCTLIERCDCPVAWCHFE